MTSRHPRRKRIRVQCPQCANIFHISYIEGKKYVRARTYGCPACGFIGRRGEFADAPQFETEQQV